jgi:hypothetical protein
MATDQRRDDIVLEYPNREKASSKTVKAVVVLLLLASAALFAIVLIGGWDKWQGTKPIGVAIILVYLILAFFVARWRSGMLPVAAALATMVLIFAAVSGPQWFARDKDGFTDPALPSEVVGMFTLALVPVSLLLIFFAMSGFRQNWHVEVEKRVDDDRRPRDRDREAPGGAYPATA